MPIASKNNKSNRPPLMVLFLGSGGTGKTRAALTFPDPLIADGEGGTRHYLNLFEGAVVHTKQFGQILKMVREFKASGKVSWKEGAENLSYSPKTFVLDPITAFWDAIQSAKMTENLASQGKTVELGTENPKKERDTFAMWGAIKTHWKTMQSEFQSAGINFVACAHEKEETITRKGDNGQMEIVKSGKVVADTEKNYQYAFDLIIRLVMEPNPKDGKTPIRYGIVMKSRLKNADGTDRFFFGQRLEKWDYETLCNGLPKVGEQPAEETEAEAAEQDKKVADKDPLALKLASEIHAKHLPKSGIAAGDFEIYLLNKMDTEGKPIANKGEDGKIHLSDITPKYLQWLIDVLGDDHKRMAMIKKIEGFKKVVVE